MSSMDAHSHFLIDWDTDILCHLKGCSQGIRYGVLQSSSISCTVNLDLQVITINKGTCAGAFKDFVLYRTPPYCLPMCLLTFYP